MSEGTGQLFCELDRLEETFIPINAKQKGDNPEGYSGLDTMPEEEYESDTKRIIMWA